MESETCPTEGCEWEAGHNTPCGIKLPDMEPRDAGYPPPPHPDEYDLQATSPFPPEEGVSSGPALPAGPQLDPTHDMAKNRSPEELMSEVNVAKKNRWLGIFIQLCRSERFLRFVERNYVIQDRIDEDKKQITTLVVESPRAVGPALSGAQKAKIFNLLKTYGARHPEKVFGEIAQTLGEEKTGIIPSATDADVKEAANVVDLKKNLD